MTEKKTKEKDKRPKGRPYIEDRSDKITQYSFSMRPSTRNLLKLLVELKSGKNLSAVVRVILRTSAIKLLIRSPKLETVKDRVLENLTEKEIKLYFD